MRGRDGGSVYTERDTKLLYWVMLRFRMSAHGPKTRSNRARSSFTHFNGPLATTVAARGLSSSSAISPVSEEKLPSLNESSFAFLCKIDYRNA